MEPKSIAFYTAVAVSILAVLSATTFPTMAQAQETDTQETQEQTEQEDNDVVTKQTDSESNEDVNDQTDSQEEESNSANSNVFFLMIRRPPRSPLFPYTTLSS